MNRYLVQRLGFALLGLLALLVVVPILLVVGAVFVRGIGAISWEFLTAMPREGMKAGGIFPAIVGTLVLTLGTALTAYTTRILRSAIIETLQSEYLPALRARGIGKRLIIGRHILKNALIPVVTVLGIEFGMILEGAVITETVFSWPGLGELMVSAVSNRDYPLIQGLVLFAAITFILINFSVDIIYRYLDPRIRLS